MQSVIMPTRSSLAFRGLLNILLGVTLVMWPKASAYVVVVLFALNLIFVGLYEILQPLINKKVEHNMLEVVLGILGVTFGVYLLIRPEFAALLIGLLIAFWAILFGIYDFVIGYKSHKLKLESSWVFIVAAIVSILFGLYMLISPVTGILTIVWLFGLYAIVIGVLLCFTSLFLKKGHGETKKLNSK